MMPIQQRQGEIRRALEAREEVKTSELPRWMRGPAVLKDISGDRETGACGVSWCGWNGDRFRGWGFDCACGFCTPLRREFSEGLDLLEAHWKKEDR